MIPFPLVGCRMRYVDMCGVPNQNEVKLVNECELSLSIVVG